MKCIIPSSPSLCLPHPSHPCSCHLPPTWLPLVQSERCSFSAAICMSKHCLPSANRSHFFLLLTLSASQPSLPLSPLLSPLPLGSLPSYCSPCPFSSFPPSATLCFSRGSSHLFLSPLWSCHCIVCGNMSTVLDVEQNACTGDAVVSLCVRETASTESRDWFLTPDFRVF